MILNYDLIREILLNLESKTDGYRNYSWQVLYEESTSLQDIATETIFRYHIKYLYDAGYIQSDSYLENIIDLTPLGRDYLNNVRDSGIWETTKKHISKLGNVTLPIISEVAKAAVLKSLGLKD